VHVHGKLLLGVSACMRNQPDKFSANAVLVLLPRDTVLMRCREMLLVVFLLCFEVRRDGDGSTSIGRKELPKKLACFSEGNLIENGYPSLDIPLTCLIGPLPHTRIWSLNPFMRVSYTSHIVSNKAELKANPGS